MSCYEQGMLGREAYRDFDFPSVILVNLKLLLKINSVKKNPNI